MTHDIKALQKQIDQTLESVYGKPAATTFEAAPKRKITLVVEGDSWFDYVPSVDVIAQLRNDRWAVNYQIFGKPHYGALINDMIYDIFQLSDTIKILRERTPDAFLFSGGGNDIAGDPFFSLLNHHASGLASLNATVAAGIINETLRVGYERLIELVIAEATKFGKPNLPIVLHGYAYAEPDGRGWGGGFGPLPGPWLDPGFELKGYPKSDMELRRSTVRTMIDVFNAMIADLAKKYPNNVHAIDLRGLLKQDKNDWANELHPTPSGFRKVAEQFDATLRQLIP